MAWDGRRRRDDLGDGQHFVCVSARWTIEFDPPSFGYEIGGSSWPYRETGEIDHGDELFAGLAVRHLPIPAWGDEARDACGMQLVSALCGMGRTE